MKGSVQFKFSIIFSGCGSAFRKALWRNRNGQSDAPRGTDWAFDLRRFAGEGADEPDEGGRVRHARSAGDLRHLSQYRKLEGKREKRTATGLAPQGQAERTALPDHEYFRGVPSRTNRRPSEDDVHWQRFPPWLCHLRGRKIEPQRSCQRRRVAALLEFRNSREMCRQGPAATPLTHDVPSDVAANVFSNVSTVEIAEPAEANYPGVRVQRCS